MQYGTICRGPLRARGPRPRARRPNAIGTPPPRQTGAKCWETLARRVWQLGVLSTPKPPH
eukprot:5009371-Lingulodinium_polyedra.AAC.1